MNSKHRDAVQYTVRLMSDGWSLLSESRGGHPARLTSARHAYAEDVEGFAMQRLMDHALVQQTGRDKATGWYRWELTDAGKTAAGA